MIDRVAGRPSPLSWAPRVPPAAFGWMWAALAVLTFSGWFATTRFTVTHTLSVWDVIALRFGIGALLLLPVLLRARPRLSVRAWREGSILSVLWGAPFVFFVALGLQWTSAAQASSVTPALMSVFAGMMFWALGGERPGRLRAGGYAAILAGVVVLIAAGRGSDPLHFAGGTAALVVAAVMWAGYTVRLRKSGLTSLQAAALVCVFSAIYYVPVYTLLGLSRLQLASRSELALQVIYQGVFMSVVATIAFNRAVDLLGPVAAGAIIALVPVMATAIAAIALHELPSTLGLGAIVVIAVGVALAARPSPGVTIEPRNAVIP